MKRLAALFVTVAIAVAVLGLAGCGGQGTTTGSKPATSTLPPGHAEREFVTVNKDIVFLDSTKTTDASQFPKTALTGAPSNIPYFKPVKDEGVLNRVYAPTDAKTFKFLTDMNQALVPQWYDMFMKNGGTLNAAIAKTGFKFEGIQDSGATKLVPNFMLGYYDFAYVPFNTLSTYWSGIGTQYKELWRGVDYVVVGASYRGGSDLIASPSITSPAQLAGKIVGIMRPDFSNEAMLNKWLSSAGMATESAGGTVKVESGSPGYIMNDLISKKVTAAFVYGKYAAQLKAQFGFKSVVPWSSMGYGPQRPLMLLVARRDIIEKHPDIVQAVVQANYDATARAVTVGDYKAPSDAAFTAYWMKYYNQKPNIQDPPAGMINAQASPEFMHAVVDYMTKCAYFKIPYTYEQLVDESFYNNVKK